MFIKLSIILVLAASIIVDADEVVVVEKPLVESVTRGGRKFLGLFSVHAAPLKLFLNKSKRWRGDLFLAFGPHRLIATSVEFNHAYTRDPLCIFCLQHPQQFNTLVNQGQHPQHFENGIEPPVLNDPLDSSNSSSDIQLSSKPTSVSVSATASLSAHTEAPTTRRHLSPSHGDALRTLKLEDYDVITLDPVNDESDESALNRVRRESGNSEAESDDERESTTVESSALHTTMPPRAEEVMSASNNHVVTISPMLELPQNPAQDFSASTLTSASVAPYPPSSNVHAQHVSIASRPVSSYGVPVKNFYDFYPSQPDFGFHSNYFGLIPQCVANFFRHRFAPISYGDYHHQQQHRNYQWK